MIRPAFLVAACVLLSTPVAADGLRVVDGDGLHLNGVSVRLWGIDAPEITQSCERAGGPYPCGKLARDYLVALVQGRPVTCETINTDPYGRQVSRCSVDGSDLAGRMVRAGHALDWPRYSGGAYAADQDTARKSGRGLWSGEFVQPWQWRADR